MAAGAASGFADGLPGLSFSKPEIEPGEPLKLEIASFLKAVRTGAEPRVTARQGREALALALEIQRAMVEHAGGLGWGGVGQDCEEQAGYGAARRGAEG
jgi:hypothetical protein